MKKIQLKDYWSMVKDSASEFIEDNCVKLAAALSYYTVFSLAPMLLVIISVASIFLGREAIQGELFGQIQSLVGQSVAVQLQEIIKNAELSNKSGLAATVGIGTLVIGATTLFAEMQDSINFIWSIKAKPKRGWLKLLKTRLISFSLILSLGFLLIVSLGINALVELLSNRLETYFSEVSVVIFYIVNQVVVLAIITLLFSVIFKVLPDGELRWKECLVGAAFTAFLFLIGKFLITFYLGQSDLGATYGASASIVILLTWVYYSSIILYFGAEFTKVYARYDGSAIIPHGHAVMIVRQERDIHTGEVISHKDMKETQKTD
ncbi:YihY/virulence factor BrkB family protein [Telluribacter sp. SYSU D00476]|uniref:YihY/virulence factor BrkB family protein n=1 Tax=Telluribacter sp. SYSU D00476 TaxID=2811430 RepID=UPI001FF3A2A4|nr:YihY/virulence factor BrkB family protein [Telluribacter sp. SYSU D00476]